ncbi:MAG: barstar family protein [Leptospiraceae bacterium]|nr:barstar family protein [Leptospiraceae bacterium]MCP5500672.1 barstar family protein [Leptospiraceae bacterium]
MKKKEKTFIIQGEKIKTLDDFYDEVSRLLGSLTGKGASSRNLNALIDVLRGGFGAHEFMEKITIVWSNFHLSKKFEGKKAVLEILSEAENVTFITEEFSRND